MLTIFHSNAEKMKKILIGFVFLLFSTALFGQAIVNLTTSPMTVPNGKKWVLESKKEVLVELSDLSLRSSNLCNIRLRGNPRSLGSIVVGEFARPEKIYAFELEDLIKTPYTGVSVYMIKISRIFDSEKNSINKVTFYPEEKVSVILCLENIQLTEHELTQNEKIRIESLKKENDEKIKDQE